MEKKERNKENKSWYFGVDEIRTLIPQNNCSHGDSREPGIQNTYSNQLQKRTVKETHTHTHTPFHLIPSNDISFLQRFDGKHRARLLVLGQQHLEANARSNNSSSFVHDVYEVNCGLLDMQIQETLYKKIRPLSASV